MGNLLKRPRSDFGDVGAFWEEPNLENFGDGKRRTKNRKQVGQMRPKGRPDGTFGRGTSEEAGRAEALELASSQMFIQHASHPRGGRRIYGPPPLPPTSDSIFVLSVFADLCSCAWACLLFRLCMFVCVCMCVYVCVCLRIVL